MSASDLLFAATLGSLGLLLVPLYYAGVAALAGLLTAPRPRPEGELEHGLSALICFVDEGEALAGTVQAFLEARGDHPREVWLSGDAPSPETEALARELAREDPRVHLTVSSRRIGKSACQARVIRRVGYPVTLFLDARTRVAPETPVLLALPLSDPEVAFTTGRLLYESDQGVEEKYWTLEHWIRRHEDANGGPLGASGGLFACRTRDYVPCPAEAMLDLVQPCLLERLTGGVGRYVEEAVGSEPSRCDVASWRRARIRIQARALGSTPMLRGWLAGAGSGVAGRYLAHKLLRWYAGPSLLLTLGLLTLAPPPLPSLALAGCLLLLASLLGATLPPGRERLPALAVPGYAVLVQAVGWFRAGTGNIPRNWSPWSG